MSLADLQRTVRDALVGGDRAGDALQAQLVGGRDPLRRLELHRRHYHASLTAALMEKFPGCVWLLGGEAMHALAAEYVRRSPPHAVCIAEYGEDFPAFLGERTADRAPYVRAFAELEWRVGKVAVAASQPAVRHLAAKWPVDRLLEVFLGDAKPDEFRLAPEQVWLEIGGSLGAFSVQRLTASQFERRFTPIGTPIT